jgi:hypothetical protein
VQVGTLLAYRTTELLKIGRKLLIVQTGPAGPDMKRVTGGPLKDNSERLGGKTGHMCPMSVHTINAAERARREDFVRFRF